MRARRFDGNRTTSSPTERQSPVRVPVTTVPAPLIVKTRSMWSRVRAGSGGGTPPSMSSSAARSSSMPSPVDADTGTIGASDNAVPASRSRTSSEAIASGLLVDEVALGQRHDRGTGAQDVEDLQMLLRLGLPSFVGGHHEQHRPNRTDARQHVADEPLMARNIHEGDLAAARQRAPRVPEVDREPTALLLVPAVGVHAGEGDDQARTCRGRRARRSRRPVTARRPVRPCGPSYGWACLDPLLAAATSSSSSRIRRPRARTGSPARGRGPPPPSRCAGRTTRDRLRPGRTRPGCRLASERRTRSGPAP